MNKRLLSIFLIVAYCVILIKVMVFKVVPTITSGQATLDFGGTNAGQQANFMPLATILPYIRGENGFVIALLNVGGNIVLLLPIGFLVCMVYKNMTYKKAFLLGAVIGLSIELMQSVLRVGIFDIDDVILNALGVLCGYFAYTIITTWLHDRKYAHLFIVALLLIAAAIGSVYVISPHSRKQVSPSWVQQKEIYQ